MAENDPKKMLITSALPYVNNIPHLGNIIGSVLSADVFARYCRLSGKETIFVCGTDEHGTATEIRAKREGLTPKELCDKYYGVHKEIYEWFDISFDIFGRTSEKNHQRITQDLFERIEKNGFIESETVTQPYCSTCKTFLADRFITGRCPHCGYEDARGDQCDSCGQLLNPEELIEPRCKTDGTRPEFRETEHLFLKLDTLQPFLERWFEKASENGFWTENAVRATRAWFKERLKKRAISRDLDWGVPIPYKGFENKVFYVWFDAPIGYISITEQLTREWKEWWNDPENVSLYQFMGKDNIPFHSIIFPATLIAASTTSTTELEEWDPSSVPYTLVNHLDATEYINYEHDKFSKSRGVGVFGDNARNSGIPPDVFRYVLLYNRPEHADTQFTWNGLQERLNNELVANLGNLVHRTMTFTKKYFESSIEGYEKNDLDETVQEFLKGYKDAIAEYHRLMESVKLREAVYQLMKISSLGNQFFQEAQPWKTRKEEPERAKRDLFVLVNVVKDLSILTEPFMPQTASSIREQLGISKRGTEDLGKLSLSNHTVKTPRLLFEKIDDETVHQLRDKYSGSEQEGSTDEKNPSASAREPEDSGSGESEAEGSDDGVTSQDDGEHDDKDADVDEAMSHLKRLDLRVARIVNVTQHPKADKLYIEQIDYGDGISSQIVSGLVPYYDAKELVGKHVVVVRNLKPVKLRGEWSNGMLLAADDGSGSKEGVGLILAPDSAPGMRVVFKGGYPDPAKQVSMEEFAKVTFALEDGVLSADGRPLVGEDGSSLQADRLTDGKVQ